MDTNNFKLYKIAVLIPCYNEEQTIAKVVKDYKKAFPTADIYVYDNNSTDYTQRNAIEAGAIVRICKAQGKGNVIRQMFREIEADCYIMTDGDDTYPPVPEMFSQIVDNKVDMVIGDRLSSTYFAENKRPFHNVGNSMVRAAINSLFRTDIKDVMTGCRAFSYAFVKTFPVLSKGFEIETEMTIHAVDKNMALKNIPIDYRDRPEGSVSKLNTVSDGIRVIKTIGKLYRDYKPLGFFGGIALILLVLSFWFFVPIMTEYLKTGLVPQFPTLMVCGFCAITAVLALFAGMILQTIIQKHKQEFEFRLQIACEMYRKKIKDDGNYDIAKSK